MTVEVFCAGCGAFVKNVQAESGPPKTFGTCDKCNKAFFHNPVKAVDPVNETVEQPKAKEMKMSSPAVDVLSGKASEPIDISGSQPGEKAQAAAVPIPEPSGTVQ